MSNVTRYVDSNDNDEIIQAENLVCTHDFIKLRNVVKKCSVCGRRKLWPWVKMVKCRICKIVVHRRCLRSKLIDCQSSTCHEIGYSNDNDSASALTASEPIVSESIIPSQQMNLVPSIPSQQPEPVSIVPLQQLAPVSIVLSQQPVPLLIVSQETVHDRQLLIDDRGEPLESAADPPSTRRKRQLTAERLFRDNCAADEIVVPPGVHFEYSSYLREGLWTTMTEITDRRNGERYRLMTCSRIGPDVVCSIMYVLRDNTLLYAFNNSY